MFRNHLLYISFGSQRIVLSQIIVVATTARYPLGPTKLQERYYQGIHLLDGDKGDLPPTKKRKTKSSLDFDVRGELYRMTGVDLTRIDGFNETSVLKILAETGIDITPWPTEKHFSSWLGLSPGNKITGGKILTSKTKPSANRAAAAFRMAVFGLFNSKSALGAYYRRQRTRLGSPKAITATAHKLARTFCSMLKNGSEYVDQGQDYYEKQYRDRATKNLKKRAAFLGFDLVPNKEEKNMPDAELSTT